jgi:hypothetical protein
MGLKLEQVVPWGRSLDEYIRLFALTPQEMKLKILDIAGGPASFNAEMTRLGNHVISCDPIYQFTENEIAQRIQETYSVVIQGTKANQDSYLWHEITSPEELGKIRMAAMQRFLEDFSLGLEEKRYINAELPSLPFTDAQFDLALCSHFLFTYSDLLSAEFHLTAITELCRVASEVRIFPILNISGELSPQLSVVMGELTNQGYQVEIKPVNYEFQKGGNQFLQVCRYV